MRDRSQKSATATAVLDSVPVFPLLVTPLNVDAVCGDNWRHIVEWARGNGVTIYQLGKRPVIKTTDLLAAIEQYGAPHQQEVEAPTGATEAELIRRSLGKRRRRGS